MFWSNKRKQEKERAVNSRSFYFVDLRTVAYLEDTNLVDAQELLDEFESETDGDEDWKNLMQMEIDLATDTLTVFDMDSTQEALVRAIAYTGETSLAKANAQSILALVFGEEFEIELIEPSGKTDEEEPENTPEQTQSNNEHPVFKLYPNPTTGDVYIAYMTGINDAAYIEVFDVLGEKVSEIKLQQGYNISKLPLPTNAKGILIYRIFVNNSVVKSGKLVVLNK